MLQFHFKNFRQSALLICLISFCTAAVPAIGQNIPKPTSPNWLTNGRKPAFVENKGQFLSQKPELASQIIYGTENSSHVYFTPNGLVYELAKRVKMSKEEEKTFEKIRTAAGRAEEEDEDEGRKMITHYSYVQLQWIGANANPEIVTEGKHHEYWNYMDPKNQNRTINYLAGYDKITYKNLYPGIDLVYTFHPEGGIKYALTVHPGADLAAVKMQYTGADKIRLDQQGILHIITENGEVTDHAPVTFYESDRSPVGSAFELNDNTIRFSLENYDQNRTLIIDPWTVTSFTPAYTPLELGRDAQNNVCVYGTDATQQFLEKYDPNGVLQWTVNLTTTTAGYDSYFGDLAVDPTGFSYVSKGLVISPLGTGDAKFDPAGVLVWNNGTSPWMYENWRVTFNCDFTQAINSGCGPACCNGGRIDILDPVTGTEVSFTAPSSAGDMICTCFGQNGLMYNVNVNNSIICLDPNNSFSLVFDLPNSYGLMDGIQLYGGSGPLGMNGIAAGCGYFYVFLGQTLEQRDLTNGTLINSVAVPGGTFLMNMGIAVDKCGNIYVGSSNGIYIYDTALTQIGYFATTMPVFEIVLGTNGTFYACGGNFPSTGFLAQFSSLSTCNPIGSTTAAASCQGADGSATVTPIFCSPPYTYLWSNGDTTATADSLSAGTYTVVVHGAGACNYTDTVTVTVPGPISLTLSQTPSACTSNNGTATATPVGGNGPYTYVWSTNPVQTTQTATGLPAGTYTVVVTDSSGCSASQTIVVQQTGGFTITATSVNPVCFGSTSGTATATPASGVPPYTYSWNTTPVQTTQTATGLGAGTYVVSITDSVGCTTTASVTITTPSAISINATTTSVGCNGGNDGTATAAGSGGTPGYSYSWNSSPVQTTATANQLPAGPYVVTVTDANGCIATQSVTVTEPAASPDTLAMTGSFCPGDSVATLYAPEGFTNYQWYENGNPISGATNDSLFISNSANFSSYSVSWFLNGCIHFTTYQVISPPFIVLNPDSVANVFTPNGDGKNDYFYPFADKNVTTAQLVYYADSYSMQIFDRWGVEVFYTNDYNFQWDGRFNGKDVPDGVYYWVVSYKSRCSNDEQMTESHGFVHLLR